MPQLFMIKALQHIGFSSFILNMLDNFMTNVYIILGFVY